MARQQIHHEPGEQPRIMALHTDGHWYAGDLHTWIPQGEHGWTATPEPYSSHINMAPYQFC